MSGAPHGLTVIREESWALLVQEEEFPKIFANEPLTESLWARRLACGGLIATEQFPPISISAASDGKAKRLAASLQLLFVASPASLHALASGTATAWELTPDHPAVRLHQQLLANAPAYGAFWADSDIVEAWTAVAQPTLFRGRFGIFFNHNEQSVPGAIFSSLWRADISEKTYDSWQNFFDDLYKPTDVSLTGATFVCSVQSCVADSLLPPYLTVHVLTARLLPVDKFPVGDFDATLRCKDGTVASVRVRWVGGIYDFKSGGLRVVFDWGDGSGNVGMSSSGDWGTQPPTRHLRGDLENKELGELESIVMIFRRV